MILSDREIWMEISSGRLKFDPPLEPEQVTPSAIDLRLSTKFTTFRPSITGTATIVDLAAIKNVEQLADAYGQTTTIQFGSYFSLEPDRLVLAYTLESLVIPNYLAARVEGRSSLARLGISIHQTAPTVHATFEGQLRLELLNRGPFICWLRPGYKICQLIVERLGSPSQGTLRSAFQNQRQP